MSPKKRIGTNPAVNPFEYGRELAEDELVDRKDELDQISRTLANRGKLFLIGPRRFGKTSLLAAAAQAATRAGTAVLRFDAERYESLDLLAEALLTGATRRLTTTVERAGSLLSRLASRLRPEVAYDIEAQSLSVTLGAAKAATGSMLPVLVDVLDAVERMAAETGTPVVVILDEFQQIIKQGGELAERQIRAAIQTHRHVGYVFAGSATRLLADMTSDPGRPFYRLGARLFLGPIPREDFTKALRAGFERAGFSVEPAALVRILDLADDVPYSVQRIAHACWEAMRVAGSAPADNASTAPLTADGVTHCLVTVLGQEDAAYTQMWTSLTIQQKRTLKAVVLEGGKELLASAVSRKFNVPTATMQRALAALGDRGLIRDVPTNGAIIYRLEDPLFGLWLRWSQQQRLA